MQEPYGEGLAAHSGPESCGGSREGTFEALTGVRAGRVLSPVRHSPRAPTTSSRAEGKIGGTAIARYFPGSAGSETPGTYGNSLHGTREIPWLTRDDGRTQAGKGSNHRGFEYRVTGSVARVTLDFGPACEAGNRGRRTENAE
jgi:hypothetical protein